MESKDLASLPVAFQIVAGLGLFFGTFTLAVGGWIWKKIKPELSESLVPGQMSSENVVIKSASIADTNSIKALAGSIDRLIEFLREDAEDDGHQARRNHSVLCEIRDELQTLSKTIKSRTIM